MKTFKQINFRDINIPNVLVMVKGGDAWFWLQNFLDAHLDGAFMLEEKEEDVQADDDKPQKDDRWIAAKDYPQVGDEIEDKEDGERFIVVKIQKELKRGEEISFFVMDQTGLTADLPEDKCKYFRKTGRHFPQIKEVLDLLKEGGEE